MSNKDILKLKMALGLECANSMSRHLCKSWFYTRGNTFLVVRFSKCVILWRSWFAKEWILQKTVCLFKLLMHALSCRCNFVGAANAFLDVLLKCFQTPETSLIAMAERPFRLGTLQTLNPVKLLWRKQTSASDYQIEHRKHQDIP